MWIKSKVSTKWIIKWVAFGEITNGRTAWQRNVCLNVCLRVGRFIPDIMGWHHTQLTSMLLEYNTASSEKYFHNGLWLSWYVYMVWSAYAIPGYNKIPFRMWYRLSHPSSTICKLQFLLSWDSTCKGNFISKRLP